MTETRLFSFKFVSERMTLLCVSSMFSSL